MADQPYKRVMLKLSGEMLVGEVEAGEELGEVAYQRRLEREG